MSTGVTQYCRYCDKDQPVSIHDMYLFTFWGSVSDNEEDCVYFQCKYCHAYTQVKKAPLMVLYEGKRGYINNVIPTKFGYRRYDVLHPNTEIDWSDD